jgi:hypothetical protein
VFQGAAIVNGSNEDGHRRAGGITACKQAPESQAGEPVIVRVVSVNDVDPPLSDYPAKPPHITRVAVKYAAWIERKTLEEFESGGAGLDFKAVPRDNPQGYLMPQACQPPGNLNDRIGAAGPPPVRSEL